MITVEFDQRYGVYWVWVDHEYVGYVEHWVDGSYRACHPVYGVSSGYTFQGAAEALRFAQTTEWVI